MTGANQHLHHCVNLIDKDFRYIMANAPKAESLLNQQDNAAQMVIHLVSAKHYIEKAKQIIFNRHIHSPDKLVERVRQFEKYLTHPSMSHIERLAKAKLGEAYAFYQVTTKVTAILVDADFLLNVALDKFNKNQFHNVMKSAQNLKKLIQVAKKGYKLAEHWAHLSQDNASHLKALANCKRYLHNALIKQKSLLEPLAILATTKSLQQAKNDGDLNDTLEQAFIKYDTATHWLPTSLAPATLEG